MRCNNFKNVLIPLLLIAVFFSNIVYAQKNEDNILSKIKLNAFLSGGYEYNLNNPSDMKNNYRIFDTEHNSFTMDVMELSFHQDIDNDTPFGFRADVVTGSSIPKTIRSSGLNCGDLDIMQMYISYIIPLGSGIRVDFGKFTTFLGYEVIENWENFNDNHSRSFSFGYSIPFAHTGVKAGYAFTDKIALALFLVNGWDNAVDNNKSKSFGAQLSLIPTEGLNIYSNYLSGPEQDNNNSRCRSIFDFVSTYSMEKLSVGLNVNFAQETFDFDLKKNWSSYACYLKYKFSNLFHLSLRGEIFKDADGLRTGTVQDLSGITITPSFNLNEHIILRGRFAV